MLLFVANRPQKSPRKRTEKCSWVRDNRTFIKDFQKVAEFVEWYEDEYKDRHVFNTNENHDTPCTLIEQ